MNSYPFREHHILQALEGYDEQHLPLDLFLSNYFRSNKALGSKDRGYIAETIYSMVRWKSLLDYICGSNPDWEKRLEAFTKFDAKDYLDKEEIPLHVRLSFPQTLFDLIADSHGLEKAQELCLVSNTAAPATVRANLLKTTREKLLEQWKDLYQVEPCKQSPDGIVFTKKINFFGLPEFKAGLFEVQDEGSQLLAGLIQAAPGQQVMDYCSGSGGKTLAFAPGMQNKGQIFLHDIRPYALMEARKRLRRSGIQNAQVMPAEDPKLKKLKKKMDWVLADVPCSGTGTMRRNPDMKWSFKEEMITRLVGQQRTIFEKALSYLHPKGHIVYATCSLLKEENEEQVAHFLKTYPLKLVSPPFQTWPSQGGMDGFFGATFTYQ